MTTTLLLAATLAAGPDFSAFGKDPPPASFAPFPLRVSPPRPNEPAPKPLYHDHESGQAEAARDGKFLVVWVGGEPAGLADGAVNARVNELKDCDDGDVLISGPWPDGKRYTFAHLRGADPKRVANVLADVKEKYAAAAGEVQARRAIPFDDRPRPATVDREDLGRGPWPDDFDFPADMERYESARMTQLVASTTFPHISHAGDFQNPVPRTVLDEKYRVNGGMVGIKGVRSDVYRNEASKGVRHWLGLITVKNSAQYTQPVTAWKTEFPEGSKFMDVLSKDGKVFEIREREKFLGRWRYSVAYEDPDARPKGYSGKIAQSCVSCHKNAGGADVEDANYNGGLPPGGDQTFSVPIPAMEGRR